MTRTIPQAHRNNLTVTLLRDDSQFLLKYLYLSSPGVRQEPFKVGDGESTAKDDTLHLGILILFFSVAAPYGIMAQMLKANLMAICV